MSLDSDLTSFLSHGKELNNPTNKSTSATLPKLYIKQISLLVRFCFLVSLILYPHDSNTRILNSLKTSGDFSEMAFFFHKT